MPVRKTPRCGDVLDIYYDAPRESVIARTIELDTSTISLQEMLRGNYSETEMAQAFAQVQSLANAALRASRSEGATYTDHHRLHLLASLFTQKALAPFLFENDSSANLRDSVAKSAHDAAVTIVGQSLATYERAHNKNDELAMQHAHGAVQEDTILTLLNTPSDIPMIALPASFEQDTQHSTDVLLYYTANDAKTYLVPLSVKTSLAKAKEEKRDHPELIVVSGEAIGNRDRAIARHVHMQHTQDANFGTSSQEQITKAHQALIADISDQLEHLEPYEPLSLPMPPYLHSLLAQHERVA